jgi:hypothetical protein
LQNLGRGSFFFFCFQPFWAGQRLRAQFSSIYLVSMLNLIFTMRVK